MRKRRKEGGEKKGERKVAKKKNGKEKGERQRT